MIREHVFNTEWWCEPVAFVHDPRFFLQDEEVCRAALAPYSWAEFKMPFGEVPVPAVALHRAGFLQADIQIEFRIGLRQVPPSSSLQNLEVQFADEAPFAVGAGDSRIFGQERFALLPGITPDKLNRRYIDWANRMISEQPEWCVQVLQDGAPQGWLISSMANGALDLTLGMLHAGAQVAGMHLYHRAMLAYAERGARLGAAAFSATNLTVLNIYAALGARFTGARGCWLWLS